MSKKFFKSDNIDLQNALDLILYIGQHGFTREIGQERYELVSHDWINNYADEDTIPLLSSENDEFGSIL